MPTIRALVGRNPCHIQPIHKTDKYPLLRLIKIHRNIAESTLIIIAWYCDDGVFQPQIKCRQV